MRNCARLFVPWSGTTKGTRLMALFPCTKHGLVLPGPTGILVATTPVIMSSGESREEGEEEEGGVVARTFGYAACSNLRAEIMVCSI